MNYLVISPTWKMSQFSKLKFVGFHLKCISFYLKWNLIWNTSSQCNIKVSLSATLRTPWVLQSPGLNFVIFYFSFYFISPPPSLSSLSLSLSLSLWLTHSDSLSFILTHTARGVSGQDKKSLAWKLISNLISYIS